MLPNFFFCCPFLEKLLLLLLLDLEANVPLFQVSYYLAELTEKIAEDGRIKVLKASQAKLKVELFWADNMWCIYVLSQTVRINVDDILAL